MTGRRGPRNSLFEVVTMRLLLALSVFFLSAHPARGQDAHRDPGALSLDPGTLLRVHTQSRVIEGRVVRIDADSVVVQTLNRIRSLSWPDAAAVSDVVALDIGTSRSRSDGAKRLAAAGLMVGSLAGLLLAPEKTATCGATSQADSCSAA